MKIWTQIVQTLILFGQSETSLNAAPVPQRRFTAQEMCYQRMQKAQQQAAQLAAAVKSSFASTSPVLGLSGEKRRVAHRPNASLSSPKPAMRATGMRVCICTVNLNIKSKMNLKTYHDKKKVALKLHFLIHFILSVFACFLGLADASSRVLSPTRASTDQLSVKAHTSAGILSKTTFTTAQKRVAHTPTLKVKPYSKLFVIHFF